MKEKIEIYTLAEDKVFWAVIKNFLGWSYECTYPTSQTWKVPFFNQEEQNMIMLRKVAEKGGRLHVYHLFTPFKESDLPQYNRRFIANAVRLMRFIVRTDGLEVEWDVSESCKETLIRNSPPLYYRIFGKEDCRKFLPTEGHIAKMAHAIGLDIKQPKDGVYDAYRNGSFYDKPNSLWDDLVRAGYAIEQHKENDLRYFVTPKGFQFLARHYKLMIRYTNEYDGTDTEVREDTQRII